jgi:hypothetical protein
MDTPIQATRTYRRGTLDRIPTRTRLARREASTPEILRLARPRVDPPNPPTHRQSIQCNHFHQRGHSAIGVGAASTSNLTFYCPSRDGR